MGGDKIKPCLILHTVEIVAYFNKEILKKPLLSEDVVSPQRHIFGNKQTSAFFIKSRYGKPLDIKAIFDDCDKNGINQLKEHEVVIDMELESTY